MLVNRARRQAISTHLLSSSGTTAKEIKQNEKNVRVDSTPADSTILKKAQKKRQRSARPTWFQPKISWRPGSGFQGWSDWGRARTIRFLPACALWFRAPDPERTGMTAGLPPRKSKT